MGGHKISARANGYILGNDLLIGFAFFVVLARFYCRIWMGTKRGLWWDDLFLLLAYLFAIGFGVCVNVAMAHYGWDRHIWTIPASMLSKSVKLYIATKICFAISGTCVRMSLLFFYLWLVKDLAEKGIKRVIYGFMVLNGALCLACLFLSVFQCWPIRAAWMYELRSSATCLDESVSITTTAAFLSAADLVVNVLPLPIVARLNVPFKQRVAATVLLSLGTVATAAGVVREVYVYKAFIQSHDSTWNSLPLWICADVEIYVGLLCACVPSLRPLWSKASSWVSNNLTTHQSHPASSSHKSAGELQLPPTMSWHDFDKDVTFDGSHSFNSASQLWGRKKSNTTTVVTQIEKPASASDSFFHRHGSAEETERQGTEMKDLEAGWPKKMHVRTSSTSQTRTM